MQHEAQETVRHRLAIDAPAGDVLLDEWREVYGRMLLRLDLEPAPEAPFRFHADFQAWPGFAFSRVVTSGMRGTRSTDLVADGRDDIGLVAVTAGSAVVNQCGREIQVGEGEAVLLRSSEPGEVWFPSGARYFNLAMPAKSLEALVPEPDSVAMASVSADSAPLRLALRYASLLLECEDSLVATGMHHIVAGHFRDLAVAMIGETGETVAHAVDGIRAARLRSIKAHIVSNLASHDLSVGAVAARHGITPRYVGRLFESEGTSFSQFVLSKRLAWAHQALIDPRYAHHSISSIAGDAGFGDISYFNRAFRRRYGATPSEIRVEGLLL